jgi:hypothetical protein
MGNHKKIPSVISFSPSTEAGEQQWGYDLSEDAISMVHTKLELDLQDVASELDLMLHALDGMKNFSFDYIKKVGVLPAYTDKTAEQVVTEYLSRVFVHLSAVILDFSEAVRVRVPVDIVVTVPTVCSIARFSWLQVPVLPCDIANANTGMVLQGQKLHLQSTHFRRLQSGLFPSTVQHYLRDRA